MQDMLALLVLLAVISCGQCLSETEEYRYAAVSADNELCSTLGTEVMIRRGGSAVDAAIASLVCLGAVNAQSSGIGGGFIFTIYDPEVDDVTTLNARESAPTFAHPDMFEGIPEARETGPLSIMVPREIWGYWEAWQNYGQVPWSALFEDTIELCRRGWPVSFHMANAINNSLEDILADPGLRRQYLKNLSTPFEEGDLMQDFNLANTLEIIATEGPEAFYNGSLAPIIIEELQSYGAANYTLADLASHFPIPMWYEPVSTRLRNGDYTMWTPPVPSSGPIINFIMTVLDGYEIQPSDNATISRRELLYHRVIETFKFGFARRSFLEDIEFANDDVLDLLDLLSNRLYCERIRSLINDDSVLDDYYPEGTQNMAPKEMPGQATSTTHLNVMDPNGLAVSATATIGAVFGSKTRGQTTGIVYNNMMNLFTTPAMSPRIKQNYPEPLKRGQSSTVPVLIKDSRGYVRMLAGGAGGPRIITSTAQTILHHLWLGADLQRAVDQPRVHAQSNETVYYEPNFETAVERGLRLSKGQPMEDYESNIAVVTSIRANQCPLCWEDLTCRDNCIVATSDFRKRGKPDGF